MKAQERSDIETLDSSRRGGLQRHTAAMQTTEAYTYDRFCECGGAECRDMSSLPFSLEPAILIVVVSNIVAQVRTTTFLVCLADSHLLQPWPSSLCISFHLPDCLLNFCRLHEPLLSIWIEDIHEGLHVLFSEVMLKLQLVKGSPDVRSIHESQFSTLATGKEEPPHTEKTVGNAIAKSRKECIGSTLMFGHGGEWLPNPRKVDASFDSHRHSIVLCSLITFRCRGFE
jgi:hypothetical protein